MARLPGQLPVRPDRRQLRHPDNRQLRAHLHLDNGPAVRQSAVADRRQRQHHQLYLRRVRPHHQRHRALPAGDRHRERHVRVPPGRRRAVGHHAQRRRLRGPGATIDTVTFTEGSNASCRRRRAPRSSPARTRRTGRDGRLGPGHVRFRRPHGRDEKPGHRATRHLRRLQRRRGPGGADQFTYDVLDRQTSITLPDGTTTTTSYGFGPDRSGTTQFTTTATDAKATRK